MRKNVASSTAVAWIAECIKAGKLYTYSDPKDLAEYLSVLYENLVEKLSSIDTDE